MRRLIALLPVLLCTFPALGQGSKTPAQHLGREPGADFKLADWKEISAYFRHLGDTSPRVRVDKVGTSTLGRDFLMAVISSEQNLARLDELKAKARGIARGELEEKDLDDAKVFLFISCNMHSTEIGAPEMAMTLAHDLATSDDAPWAAARKEVVVVLFPTLNPDGLDRVVHWYRRIVGTPYENASLTQLYQLYAGHDNNRDWFSLSLKETQIVTKLLYQEWFPQVYWDVHQQGSSRERMFVPPFRDPLNPNLDPAIIAGIGVLGGRMLLDLTREGLTGVSTGVTYDMWWSGGNRNVPVRHNIIGLLTEAASANLASPIFLPRTRLSAPRGIETGYRPSNRFPAPWPGGWWRIGDIHKYELACARSLLGSLAREPRTWLKGALAAAKRATERGKSGAPFAWLIPADNRDRDAVHRLVATLLAGGVEIVAANAAFQADELDYPKGTLIIRRAQPYGAYAKDLFEVQRYPDGPAPYDVAGWTLPLLLGVRRVEATTPFDVETRPVKTVEAALGALPRPRAVAHAWPSMDGGDTASFGAVFAMLEAGLQVHMVTRTQTGGGVGDWLVRPGDASTAVDIAKRHDARLTPGTAGAVKHKRMPVTRRRLGVYAPWTTSMDEGWLRWVLDHHKVKYRRIRNEAIRAGKLNDHLDVLLVPSISSSVLRSGRQPGTVFPRYAGGLDPEGLVALEEFVKAGGTLVTFDRASDFAIQLFGLEIESAVGTGDERFQCPGSILRTVPHATSPWTAGLGASQPIFYSNSRAYRVKESKVRKKTDDAAPEVLLSFPKDGVLLSGWAKNPAKIADAAAWMRVRIGKGQLHLFSFRPHYRSWAQTTYKALFRAVLLPP